MSQIQLKLSNTKNEKYIEDVQDNSKSHGQCVLKNNFGINKLRENKTYPYHKILAIANLCQILTFICLLLSKYYWFDIKGLISMIIAFCGSVIFGVVGGQICGMHCSDGHNVSEINRDYQFCRQENVKLVFYIDAVNKIYKHLFLCLRRDEQVQVRRHQMNVLFDQIYDVSGMIQHDREFRKNYIEIQYSVETEFLIEEDIQIIENNYDNFKRQFPQNQHKQTIKRLIYSSHLKQKQPYRIMYYQNEAHPAVSIILILGVLFFISYPINVLLDRFLVERYEIKLTKKVKIDQSRFINRRYA